MTLCAALRYRIVDRSMEQLEPSRRLSKTTGGLNLSAFRVAVSATEVTNCAVQCGRSAQSCTRSAPELGLLPEHIGVAAQDRHRNSASYICSRDTRMGGATP